MGQSDAIETAETVAHSSLNEELPAETNTKLGRDPVSGRFLPGVSGHPGRIPSAKAQFQTRMFKLSVFAEKELRTIATDPDTAPSVRLKAIELILWYAWGKPVEQQAISVSGTVGIAAMLPSAVRRENGND